MDSYRVVVGVDGSEGSAAALRFAHAEASLRSGVLEAVVALDMVDERYMEAAGVSGEDAQVRAASYLRGFLIATLGREAADSIDVRAVFDRPAPAIIAAGRDADLTVVGARGTGGFKRLRLGSVSHHVLVHSHGAVAVVHSLDMEAPPTNHVPLLVGVDGSEASRAALRWAGDEARLRNTSLIALHACETQALVAGPFFSVPVDPEALRAGCDALLDRELGQVPLDDVVVERRIAQGGAAEGILSEGAHAAMIVVGARGHGGFAGMLLGSVTEQVAQHANRPVVVVKPGR